MSTKQTEQPQQQQQVQQVLSDWIPVSTPPTIEGVYETVENDSTGYQRYKDGIWGPYSRTLEQHNKYYPSYVHFETCYPPEYWRGLIDVDPNAQDIKI